MDNVKYMKSTQKLQPTRSKTRSIGVNTEENYPKCNCHSSENLGPRFVLVPCLPYYYPMCTNNNNNCCTPNFNINPNILNQYQFVHNGNDMNHFNKCEKHSDAINLLHCCSSSNCTSCTNSSSSASGNNQKVMNAVEVNQSGTSNLVKKNPRENGLRRNSQDKISLTLNEKHPIEIVGNNSYYEGTSENIKQYCDEEMTRYATELLDSQNYKMAQEYEQSKINNDEKKIMNHLLTPTGRKFPNALNTATDDSDECLVDSENEDETSSIEEDIPVIKVSSQEEERKRPSTADGRTRSNFNPFQKFSKPNSGKSSDLEMLMMLKAFVNQNADKDVNPKLNQLINHLSSQETSIRTDGQIESKKSFIPRK